MMGNLIEESREVCRVFLLDCLEGTCTALDFKLALVATPGGGDAVSGDEDGSRTGKASPQRKGPQRQAGEVPGRGQAWIALVSRKRNVRNLKNTFILSSIWLIHAKQIQQKDVSTTRSKHLRFVARFLQFPKRQPARFQGSAASYRRYRTAPTTATT